MEAQSNLIPESARIHYARIWADFTEAVGRGEAKTLSSYCRLTHTSYEGIKYWIRSQGLSVKSLKKSDNTQETALTACKPEARPVSFIQFAPSAAMKPIIE